MQSIDFANNIETAKSMASSIPSDPASPAAGARPSRLQRVL